MAYKSIFKNIYRSVAKSVLSRYLVYGANLMSMMLLARLFTPEIFGAVASVAVFYLFFQLIAEGGLGPAIINLDKLSNIDRDGLFGLTVFVGLLTAWIFYLLAPVFGMFYHSPRTEEVVPYIAMGLFFYTVSIVPTALLLRDQAFFSIANAGLVAEVLSTTATVTLVYWLDPLHALAAKAAFSAAGSFGIVYCLSKNTEFGRPAFGVKFSAIKPLLAFSGYQFGFNIVNYFSRNLDNILIGKYLGATSLGVYDKAYQLMRYPLMLLTFAMTPAIQPVIRKHAVGDREKIEAIHRDFTYKLSIAGGITGLTVNVMSTQIVDIVLGDQWSDVVPIIQILSIAIPVQVILSTSGSFFQAMNRADLLFRSGLLGAGVMVSAIIFGIYYRDIMLLAWLLVAAFHINFFQAYFILYGKVFEVHPSKFLIRMIPAGALITVMVLASSGLNSPWLVLPLNLVLHR